MKDIVAQVARNNTDYQLISPGEKVLVAFSGGPDSTTLLKILHQLSRKGNWTLIACYINHNIRPGAVKKEIEFCYRFCTGLKVPFILIDSNIPAFSNEMKISLEEAGREFRYWALAELAKLEKCGKIAVGHHQDDIIETVLFRLFRGTGPQGLQPMKPISGNIIRPLLNISRQEIDIYLRKHKIRPVIDKSNLKSNFSRNFIRNRLIPIIKIHFDSKYRKSIINFAEIVSAEDTFLKEMAQKTLRKVSCLTAGQKIIVDLKKLSGYDVCLRRRIIKLILEKLANRIGAGSFENIERIERIISGKLKSVDLGGKIRAARDKDIIFFISKKTAIRETELKIEGKTLLPEINASVISRFIARDEAKTEILSEGNRINIDYDKISPACIIRGIRPGDSFSPLGMQGIKKVGNFLTDRKISKFIRDEIPLILDNQGIIWIVGQQIADRCKIDENTTNVLEIEIIRGKGDGNT